MTTTPDLDTQAAGFEPRDVLAALWRRKWLIAAVTVLSTAAVYAYFSGRPERYQASTKVFFQGSGAAALIDPNVTSDPDRNLVNQATLLTSRDVAVAVAQDIGFRGDPRALVARVEARPASSSDFILITAQAPNGQEAAELANAFARAFIRIRSDRLRREIDQQLRETQVQLRQTPVVPATSEERAELAATVRQLRLARSLPGANAQQIDPAIPPAVPVAPRPERNAVFAFFLALLAACGLAFVLERFDRRVKRIEDIADAYGAPVLSALPLVDDPAGAEQDGLTLPPALREPFRTLRTNVQLAALDRPLRKVLVASATANAGKSTVVRNLALAFRESGLRVAIVDGDLRKPSVERMLRIEPEGGLVEVLTGQATIEETMVTVATETEGLETIAKVRSAGAASTAAPGAGGNGNHADVGGLRVLSSGPQPANPQAVLGADKTRLVLDEIAGHNDIVLIDSSPLLAVSDAIPLLRHVDGVLLVARIGESTLDEAADVRVILQRVPGLHVLGVVANGVRDGGAASYYGYR